MTAKELIRPARISIRDLVVEPKASGRETFDPRRDIRPKVKEVFEQFGRESQMWLETQLITDGAIPESTTQGLENLALLKLFLPHIEINPQSFDYFLRKAPELRQDENWKSIVSIFSSLKVFHPDRSEELTFSDEDYDKMIRSQSVLLVISQTSYGEGFFHLLCNLKQISPASYEKMLGNSAMESVFPLSEKLVNLYRKSGEWNRVAQGLAESRLLFPERFSAERVTQQDWRQMRNMFENGLEVTEFSGIIDRYILTLAYHMTILAAQEAVVTEEGIKLTMNSPLERNQAQAMPTPRLF